MKKSILALVASCLLAAPGTAIAQGFGFGARVGTLGAGAEAAIGLSSHLVVRGGIGLLPLERSATISGIPFTLTLPKTWYNIGVDLYIAGPVRIGAGMLFKPDDPVVDATIDPGRQVGIGDTTYTAQAVFKLHGILDSQNQAPYVLLGFGKHTASGIGLFLDLGVAFLGDPAVSLSASGDPTIVNDPRFQTELRREETNVQNDAGTYLKLWPVLSLGVRVGTG